MTSDATEHINNAIAHCSGRLVERQQIADLLIHEPTYFEYAIQIFLDPNAKHTNRLSWCIDLVYRQHAALFKGHIATLIQALEITNNDSTLRCLVKILSSMSAIREFKKEMSSKEIEKLIEKSVTYLTDSHEVAVQVYAMEMLFQWRDKYHWISEALTDILHNQMEFKSAAYRARAKKILKKIQSKPI